MMRKEQRSVTASNTVWAAMLNIAGIVEDSVVDGPGLRFVIFGQGCPHRCKGCHNPDTWEDGIGTEMSEEQLLAVIKRNPLSRAVTFSGGEPFAQAAGFARLARMLKDEGYEVASYSGYTFEQLIEGTEAQRDLLSAIDILIDGPFVLAERSLSTIFRGSKNQRILNAKASVRRMTAVAETSDRWLGKYLVVGSSNAAVG